MKKFKKTASRVLSAALAMSMAASLTACGGQNTTSNSASESTAATTTAEGTTAGKTYNGIDVSEHVDLKMILLGERTPDFDEVYAEINKILEDKLNCSLSVDFLSWGEHDTKYSMKFSGQEDFDIIFTAAGWAHYEQTVALGGFYELTPEFIQTYAPDIWKVVPEIAWSQATIDGKIYMVPNLQSEFGQEVCAVRGDMLEKAGMDGISSWDDIVKFSLACAEQGMYTSANPFPEFYQSKGMAIVNGAPNNGELVLYNTQDPDDLSFTYLLDWDGFTEYCHTAKELADAGAWSSDVLNSNEERQVPLMSGRAATMWWGIDNCKGFADQINAEHPDWNVVLCDPFENMPKRVRAYTNNGVALNAFGKNQERAMMVINEFYTNPEVQDLSALGIEGKHWKAVGDDQFTVIDESNYGVDGNCNWGWINETIRRHEYVEDKTQLDEEVDEMKAAWKNNIKAEHVYDGFSFDSTKVSTQVAAVEAAMGTYYAPLCNGLVDDVDKTLEEFRAAMESAGIRTVLDELNAQAEAFVASKQA